MAKVEFTKRELPTNEKELGEYIGGLQRDAEGVLQEQADKIERMAGELKLANENVERVKKLEALANEQAEQLRTLHEQGRIGSDDKIERQVRALPKLRRVEKDEDYRGKMSAPTYNLWAFTNAELRTYLDEDAYKAVKRLRKLSDMTLMAHQLGSIVMGGDMARRDEYERSGGMKSLETFAAMQEAWKPVARALSTSTSGAVAEWIPTGYSADLWEDVRDQLGASRLINFFSMPNNPYVLPTLLGFQTAYVIPEATSSTVGSNTAFTASDFTVSNRTLTAKKIATMLPWSPESEQDSIIAMIPQFLVEAAYAQAFAVETGFVNGQSTATIDTGSDPATTDPRDNFDGLRYNASLVGNPLIDFGTGMTVEKLVSMIQTMGKYADPQQASFVTGYTGLAKALVLKDGSGAAVYLTREKAGDAATLFTGSVGVLMGYPLTVSGAYPQNMNASGIIDGVTTTKTGLALFNRRAYIGGQRLGLQIEQSTEARFETDQVLTRSKQRVAMRAIVAASAARPHTVVGVNL